MAKNQANKTIRLAAKEAGVYLWQIAEPLNIRDSELSRRLRHELSEEETKVILRIIKRISDEGGNIKRSGILEYAADDLKSEEQRG